MHTLNHARMPDILWLVLRALAVAHVLLHLAALAGLASLARARHVEPDAEPDAEPHAEPRAEPDVPFYQAMFPLHPM